MDGWMDRPGTGRCMIVLEYTHDSSCCSARHTHTQNILPWRTSSVDDTPLAACGGEGPSTKDIVLH